MSEHPPVETRPREAALEPELPIIDTHHHLGEWRLPNAGQILGLGRTRYLLPEFLDDVDTGHNIVATVMVDSDAMYRADGPPEMRYVGETEFALGQAAMSASGLYGPTRVAHRIVGRIDFRRGDRSRDVLEAHAAAGNGRFRGVRQTAAWDADSTVVGWMFDNSEGLYRDEEFRRGFAHLKALDLSFEAFVLAPQLGDVVELAQAFPDTRIVLNHTGQPVGVGGYQGRRDELFDQWRRGIEAVARCENTVVKLGGIGTFIAGFASYWSRPPATSAQLAEEYRPYIRACIEAFGPDRAMFESNYPLDAGAATYPAVWNAFKIITAEDSPAERADLFAGTAARFYRIDLPGTPAGTGA
ncbi:amidohydrolase family protein [Streptomyces sp. NPDC047061]|uniref:amidohydrolase family protein n=1 Tax=Streptomyces sp. NPDC047061 TaxID=3154605 RepID=UPI0033CC94C0